MEAPMLGMQLCLRACKACHIKLSKWPIVVPGRSHIGLWPGAGLLISLSQVFGVSLPLTGCVPWHEIIYFLQALASSSKNPRDFPGDKEFASEFMSSYLPSQNLFVTSESILRSVSLKPPGCRKFYINFTHSFDRYLLEPHSR